MIVLKTYSTTKIIKSKQQPKDLKNTLTSFKLGKHNAWSFK